MSVLVNGSATSEFVVNKGLLQEDPLSPFLFILVMEGLTKMLHKAVNQGLFVGFKVNDYASYNIVQFTYDTLLIGEANWDNLWSVKAVLQGFEMVFGLKVNFVKSRIGGVNLSSEFLEAASVFCIVKS
ncbi:unnamed protein product [Lathyrus sativus]|nr:unnamed protein product [Lathyrus sativus]